MTADPIRKAWALFILDHWLAWGCDVDAPDPIVNDLVLEHHDRPIGECDACGKRAPLRHMTCTTGETDQCAWGCDG